MHLNVELTFQAQRRRCLTKKHDGGGPFSAQVQALQICIYTRGNHSACRSQHPKAFQSLLGDRGPRRLALRSRCVRRKAHGRLEREPPDQGIDVASVVGVTGPSGVTNVCEDSGHVDDLADRGRSRRCSGRASRALGGDDSLVRPLLRDHQNCFLHGFSRLDSEIFAGQFRRELTKNGPVGNKHSCQGGQLSGTVVPNLDVGNNMDLVPPGSPHNGKSHVKLPAVGVDCSKLLPRQPPLCLQKGGF
mmetsp:Transcript_52693/g.112446  ORF Transcript_52693/g.112446 Transcript_52693/m.112446 type:complete len:246 (-) Transcript_52693:1620-2357(-)